jgi:hypothetical protein
VFFFIPLVFFFLISIPSFNIRFIRELSFIIFFNLLIYEIIRNSWPKSLL